MSAKQNEPNKHIEVTNPLQIPSVSAGGASGLVAHPNSTVTIGNTTAIGLQQIAQQTNQAPVTQHIEKQHVDAQHFHGLVTFLNSSSQTFSPNPSEVTEETVNQFVKIIKAHYKSKQYIESGLDENKLRIEEGYVRLGIVKEKEQSEKELYSLNKPNVESKAANTFHDGRYTSFEDIYGTKEPIELAMLFTPDPQTPSFSSVLILGRAGIGKTTVCNHVAHSWANGKLWNKKFQLVVWIPLRNIINYTHELCSLLEVIFKECIPENHLGKKLIDKLLLEAILEKISEEKILFVLDGYDEVAHLAKNLKTPLRLNAI